MTSSRPPDPAASRGRQVVRQWCLLRMLQVRRRGLTAGELRGGLEDACSVRTIYRDLEQLQAAGFPLRKDDDRWCLLGPDEGGWAIPLSPTEVLAVSLSRDLMSPVEGSWITEALDELRRKTSAMLTPEGRAYVALMHKSAIVTLHSPGDYHRHREALDSIAGAIEKEQRLRLVYSSRGKEPGSRVVDPYSTWYADGRCYLIAWCHRRADFTTFKVDRIVAAEVLEDIFEPDPDFDPAAYARKGFRVFHGPVHRVVVELDASVAHTVRENRYHHSQNVHLLEDGRVRLVMEAAGLPEIASWVAGFGGLVRPVRPPELVEAVRELYEGGLASLSDEVVT